MNSAPTAQPAQGPEPGQLGSGSYGVGDVDDLLFARFAGPRPATPAAQPAVPGISSDFRLSEREYRMETEESVAGSAYRARPGDGISRIVGSSSPQAIGNFMRANGMTSDRVEVGRNYFRPDSVTAYGDSAALGQFALNQSNERIAAQRAAAVLARNTLVTDDITLGDLDVLNAAFGRKDSSAAFMRNFVGPLQPPTTFGEIKASPEIGLGRRLAGAIFGEPAALVTNLAGGDPYNPITNELVNFEGADRKLLALLGVAPLPFAKVGLGLRATGSLTLSRYGSLAQREALLSQVSEASTLSEAKGVVYAFREMKRLGFQLEDISLKYRGNQGLDLAFSKSGQYAIVEAKHGQGLSSLDIYAGPLRQGSADYNISRLERYLQYGDGRNAAFATRLLNEASVGNLGSFATFYRGQKIYELPLGWPNVPAVKK